MERERLRDVGEMIFAITHSEATNVLQLYHHIKYWSIGSSLANAFLTIEAYSLSYSTKEFPADERDVTMDYGLEDIETKLDGR